MVEEHETQFVKQAPANENPSLYSSHVSAAAFAYQVLQLVSTLTVHILSDFNQYPSLQTVHTYVAAVRSSTAIQFSTVINASLLQRPFLSKNRYGSHDSHFNASEHVLQCSLQDLHLLGITVKSTYSPSSQVKA